MPPKRRAASVKASSKKKPVKPAAKKAAVKAPKKVVARKPAATGLAVKIAPAVEARLRMLATKMSKTLDAVIAQALSEFADTWEDHMQTVAALKEDEARVHLTVPKE